MLKSFRKRRWLAWLRDMISLLALSLMLLNNLRKLLNRILSHKSPKNLWRINKVLQMHINLTLMKLNLRKSPDPCLLRWKEILLKCQKLLKTRIVTNVRRQMVSKMRLVRLDTTVSKLTLLKMKFLIFLINPAPSLKPSKKILNLELTTRDSSQT